MKQILIFDVDGTLTGPRRVMYDDFARFFRCIVSQYAVYLVTGSDLPKLEEQIPGWLHKDVAGSFTCSGNELWVHGEAIYRRTHRFSDDLIEFLNGFIAKSTYPKRTGNHIEARSGTLNASVVGRNATMADRQDYLRYDNLSGERVTLQQAVRDRFPAYEANCGGQISVDIAPVGWNKAQVYTQLKARHGAAQYCFFGDNIRPGGNDYPLAEAIRDDAPLNVVYAVQDHYETWKILQRDFVSAVRQPA